MVGIETRPRPAASAREALDGDAEVVHADLRTLTLEPAHAALLFDVLHLLHSDEQEALLGALAARLDPAGVVLIRETDPAVGWRFTGGSRRQRREGSRVQDLEDSGVQSAHADGMARLLCTPRISQRERGRWATGRRSPTCCSASPGRPTGLDEASHLHFLRKRTSTAIETHRLPTRRTTPGWAWMRDRSSGDPTHSTEMRSRPSWFDDGKGEVVCGEKIADGLELV